MLGAMRALLAFVLCRHFIIFQQLVYLNTVLSGGPIIKYNWTWLDNLARQTHGQTVVRESSRNKSWKCVSSKPNMLVMVWRRVA